MTTLNYRAITRILEDVCAERHKQLEEFGSEYQLRDGTSDTLQQFVTPIQAMVDQRMSAGEHTWLQVLAEEFMEAATEADVAALRREVVQIAAVAFAWLEAIDMRANVQFGCVLDVVKFAVQHGWTEVQTVTECEKLWPSIRDKAGILEAFREMKRQHFEAVGRIMKDHKAAEATARKNFGHAGPS